MSDIAYGSSNDPSLPPINLPSFGDGGQQPPLQVYINKSPVPPPVAMGGWAPYSPPDQPTAPVEATALPTTQQSSPQEIGGWQPYIPKEEPAPKTIGTADATVYGIANGLSFGFAPVISGLAAASGIPAAQPADGQTGFDVNPIRPIVGAARLAYENLIAPAIGENTGDNSGSVTTEYTKGREDALRYQQLAQQQHPLPYLGGQIASSLMVPVSGSLGAASAIGRIGKSALAGGIGGALYGAGDTASEGGSALDMAKSAVGGSVAGAALGGIAGGAIETGARIGSRAASVIRGSRNTDAEAGSRVINALRADTPQVTKTANDSAALATGREAGTPIYPVDFGGENTRALLRSAANTSPTARNIITEKLDSRYYQQSERFSSWIRSKFSAHDKDATLEALQQAARKENKPAYARAYAAGDRPIWSPELERLAGSPSVEKAIAGAVSRGKDRAVNDGFGAFNPAIKVSQDGRVTFNRGPKGVPTYPNVQFWDYVQRELRDLATAAERAGRNEEAASLKGLHRQLRDELDRLVPEFGAARKTAATFFGAENALEAGAKFVTDVSIHNAKAARVVAAMSPAERALFARGFAAELAHKIEGSGYRSDVLNSIFISSKRAAERIKIALGEDGAREFEALMRIEGIVSKARAALGNSTTIRQGHEAGMAGAGAVGLIESLHGALNPVYIVAGAFVIGGRAAAKHVDDKVAIRIAEMLMSGKPAEIARGYKVVSGNPVLRDALRRASDISVRQIVNYLRPSGVGAATLTIGSRLRGSDHKPNYPNEDYNSSNGQQSPAPSGP